MKLRRLFLELTGLQILTPKVSWDQCFSTLSKVHRPLLKGKRCPKIPRLNYVYVYIKLNIHCSCTISNTPRITYPTKRKLKYKRNQTQRNHIHVWDESCLSGINPSLQHDRDTGRPAQALTLAYPCPDLACPRPDLACPRPDLDLACWLVPSLCAPGCLRAACCNILRPRCITDYSVCRCSFLISGTHSRSGTRRQITAKGAPF